MSLNVVKPGIMDTIQDMGRAGSAHLGIPLSGAADKAALAVGNLVLGNCADTASIECHWPAPVLRLEAPALLALTGADFGATADGIPIQQNRAILLPGNAEIRFVRRHSGARAYLCVRGGFLFPEILGSRSTHVVSATGGFAGRKLATGDNIQFDTGLQQPGPALHASTHGLYPVNHLIRFTPGPEYDRLSENARNDLEYENWKIAVNSNRMGCELSGPLLSLKNNEEMVSSAVIPGTIQLPAGGKPFILLPDCQTTGGYPRIAQIIGADLPAVAQLSPGDSFRLVRVTREEALLAGYMHRLHLRRLAQGVLWHNSNQTGT